MKTVVIIFAVLVIVAAVWVRVAPFEARRWHIDPVEAPERRTGGHKAQMTVPGASPDEALSRVVAVAQAWPRTRVLFGSLDERRLSFVSRSRVWGFPDVTTVSARETETGTELTFYARLRFGGDDLGVNRARVKSWMAQLQDQSVTSK